MDFLSEQLMKLVVNENKHLLAYEYDAILCSADHALLIEQCGMIIAKSENDTDFLAMVKMREKYQTELDVTNEKYSKMLSERNIILFDKKTKLKIAGTKAALIIARNNKDPHYFKMIALKKAYKAKKKFLINKYGARGYAKARSMGGNLAGLKHNDAEAKELDNRNATKYQIATKI